jgi:hypothetical protein
MPDTGHALITATQLVAWAVETRGLLPRYATQWAARAYLATDYPGAPPWLVELFTLDDDYDAVQYACWHRSAEEIDEDVRTVVRELCARSDVMPWTADPAAARIAELILPSQ